MALPLVDGFGFEEIFSFLLLEDFIHLENKNKVKM